MFGRLSNKPNTLASKFRTDNTRKVAPKPSLNTSNLLPVRKPSTASNALINGHKSEKNAVSRSPSTVSVKKDGTSRSSSRRTSVTSQDTPGAIKRVRSSARSKRASPATSTPLMSSDDEDDVNQPQAKRIKLDRNMDKARVVLDKDAFLEQAAPYEIIHAADLANDKLQKHGRFQFEEYFKVLGEDEDVAPTIKLEYPATNAAENYQLVVPTDKSDFKPLSEIMDTMKVVAEYYLDEDARELVDPQDGFSVGGLVPALQKAAKDAQKPLAQTRFMKAVQQYNDLITRKRGDDTVQKQIASLPSPLPLKLVQHVIKDQIYSRTVSPHVEEVRKYEGFSDNVYGELLPKFLSRIFQETKLKSHQTFVDLGSGVGNCVLQAALEIGCESWGCEMMDNPAGMAEQSAKEFPQRCRMFGIQPGSVNLIHASFLEDDKIKEVLQRADVVLVNNQAFNPEINTKLKYLFLDLKESAQIVSLKYFRDPHHKVKESNINDSVNGLQVRELERFSGMVSWSDDPGKWYIHTKDKRELQKVLKRVQQTTGS
ncbi:Nucleosomal histone H3-Lys79 methylase [Elasticomyces elasticus]|nr:Nucleosomal histone H3-Lys79 methylase [Elasticomyces elasticus]